LLQRHIRHGHSDVDGAADGIAHEEPPIGRDHHVARGIEQCPRTHSGAEAGHTGQAADGGRDAGRRDFPNEMPAALGDEDVPVGIDRETGGREKRGPLAGPIGRGKVEALAGQDAEGAAIRELLNRVAIRHIQSARRIDRDAPRTANGIIEDGGDHARAGDFADGIIGGISHIDIRTRGIRRDVCRQAEAGRQSGAVQETVVP
jgi:hypothetical protein